MFDVAQRREPEPKDDHDGKGEGPARNDRSHGAEQRRRHPALKCAKFVRRSNEHVLRGQHPSTLFSRRDERNQGGTHEDAHGIAGIQEGECGDSNPNIASQPEQNCRRAEDPH